MNDFLCIGTHIERVGWWNPHILTVKFESLIITLIIIHFTNFSFVAYTKRSISQIRTYTIFLAQPIVFRVRMRGGQSARFQNGRHRFLSLHRGRSRLTPGQPIFNEYLFCSGGKGGRYVVLASYCTKIMKPILHWVKTVYITAKMHYNNVVSINNLRTARAPNWRETTTSLRTSTYLNHSP